MTAYISKLFYSWLFIGPVEHHYTTHTSKFNNFLNGASTMLHLVCHYEYLACNGHLLIILMKEICTFSSSYLFLEAENVRDALIIIMLSSKLLYRINREKVVQYLFDLIWKLDIKRSHIPGGPEITEQSIQSIFQDFALFNSYFLHLVG